MPTPMPSDCRLLRLLQAGLSRPAIAARLRVSERTVYRRLARLRAAYHRLSA